MLKTLFICDKCKKEYPSQETSSDEGRKTISIRVSHGDREIRNDYNDDNTVHRTFCSSYCKELGIDTKFIFKKDQIVQNQMSTDDKIIYFLEELGFTRGEN